MLMGPSTCVFMPVGLHVNMCVGNELLGDGESILRIISANMTRVSHV